ncbi:MAG: YhbY family RNA-binding protein [Acidithiobacillaceae bacterium]|nr:YhbY family RNA-binding protein [Acidithiobacillaceae bacterium]
MLDAKQRQNLRGQAHALKPVVMIGAQGVTDALFAELEVALDAHELIKLRLPQLEHVARDSMVETLCARSHAEAVGRIGRILILYRARPATANTSKSIKRR